MISNVVNVNINTKNIKARKYPTVDRGRRIQKSES